MNTYEVWIQKHTWDDEWCRQTIQAETASKAKYAYWNYLQDGLWEEPFGEVVTSLRCRKIGGFNVRHLFGNREQFNRMCDLRNIPFAWIGMRIEINGKMGTIVGSNGSLNLDVCMDGQYTADNCHPLWETRYFDNKGNVLKDFRESVKVLA